MAVSNTDIEKIYKLISNELHANDATEIQERIQTDPELKTEYELQKSLFQSFEEEGEKELMLYLNAHHGAFLRYGFWLRFKGYFIGVILISAVISGILSGWKYLPFETHSHTYEKPDNSKGTVILPDTLQSALPLQEMEDRTSSPDEPINKVAETVIGEQTMVMITSRYKAPLVEITPISERQFILKNGKMILKGLSAKESENLQVIKFGERLYLRIYDDVYWVHPNGFTTINDVRLKTQLHYTTYSGTDIDIRWYHREVKKLEDLKISFVQQEKYSLNVDQPGQNVRSMRTSGPKQYSIKEVIRYDQSLYAVTVDQEYYVFDKNGVGKKILELPSVHPYTDLKKTLLEVDRKKLEEMLNEH